MSAHDLAIIIAIAVLSQFAIFGAAAFYHRSQTHRQRSPSAATPASDAPAWPGLRDFRVARRVVEDEAATVCSFYLEPVDGRPLPPFAPGQYLTFHLTVADPATGATRPIVRCYSLSDRPDPGHYRVTIKRIEAPEGAANVPPGLSSGHFHRHVQAGDILAAKAPAGHFRLRGGAADPVVLIGGGIGITPMLSMLAASLDATPQPDVWLFYGVRNGAEHVMKAQLAEAARSHGNVHLHVCYSRPRAADVAGRDYQHACHVDVALLRQVLPLKAYDFYVCGPRVMMESLVPALREWGVPDARIHYEAFGPASLARKPAVAAPSAAQPLVTFAKSGKAERWSSQEASLLEFAENRGIRVESGCRAGGCGTCQTKIESGDVTYDHAPDFDPAPGTCLLCVSVPKSDLTLAA